LQQAAAAVRVAAEAAAGKQNTGSDCTRTHLGLNEAQEGAVHIRQQLRAGALSYSRQQIIELQSRGQGHREV
jgi:hypothetical protein